jgi:hypothetical protein
MAAKPPKETPNLCDQIECCFWTILELTRPSHDARRGAVRSAAAPLATLYSDLLARIS